MSTPAALTPSTTRALKSSTPAALAEHYRSPHIEHSCSPHRALHNLSYRALLQPSRSTTEALISRTPPAIAKPYRSTHIEHCCSPLAETIKQQTQNVHMRVNVLSFSFFRNPFINNRRKTCIRASAFLSTSSKRAYERQLSLLQLCPNPSINKLKTYI